MQMNYVLLKHPKTIKYYHKGTYLEKKVLLKNEILTL